MNGVDLVAVFWLLIAIQVFGLIAACAARLSQGSACQVVSQWLFFLALPVVGAATCAALAIGPGMWVACAGSLAAMILMATWDLRVAPEVAVW